MGTKKIVGKVVGAIITVTGIIGGSVLIKKNSKASKTVIKNATNTVKEAEPCFGGVPLSKFNEIAKGCYRGISCTIDKWGFLVFNHRSNRGHQIQHAQMMIDDAGKLVNLGGHYPGQWKSTADVFAETANKTLKLKK